MHVYPIKLFLEVLKIRLMKEVGYRLYKITDDKNNRLTVLAFSLSDISKVYPNAKNIQLTESEPIIIIHNEELDDNSELGYGG